MSNATNITYGTYDFQRDGGPVPLLTINKEFKKIGDGTTIGSVFKVGLAGKLNLVPSGIDGYQSVDNMQDALISGFAEDCLEFKVACGESTLIQQYPRINSISFSPTSDNWASSSEFSIDLEWDGDSYSGLWLDSINESWDLQLDNQSSRYQFDLAGGTGDNNMHLVSLSHAVSAKGTKNCNSGRPAWQEAREYVVGQLGYTSGQLSGSGIFNLGEGPFSGFNHSRVQKIDQSDGNFGVTESWLFADTGFQDNCGPAIEDFSATVSYDSSNGLTNISINGSIQGLETVSFGSDPGDYVVTGFRYDAASGFWDDLRPKLPGRASLLAEGAAINPIVLSYNIAHNPTKGTINYTYAYNNRPCNFIANALFENISISDTNPTDVFAEIAILGRAYGPVLQSLGTITSSTRSVSIDAVMGPTTGCVDIINSINSKPDVTDLLCDLQTDLSGVNTQLFKTQDSESWDVKLGRYTRNVAWTYVPCAGTAPETSFCP
jgi:hypothetical protein